MMMGKIKSTQPIEFVGEDYQYTVVTIAPVDLNMAFIASDGIPAGLGVGFINKTTVQLDRGIHHHHEPFTVNVIEFEKEGA